MADASEVPNRFDLVIDGKGYMLSPVDADGNPTPRAMLGFTPAFVPRSNVQGDFGDNYQDYWLTATQRDWSLGEQQRYYRSADENRNRRYWEGSAVNVSTPGRVKMREGVDTETFGATVSIGSSGPDATLLYVCSLANLYTVTRNSGPSLVGTHGLGALPRGMTTDGQDLYMSTTASGTVGVRKYDGSAFSTFSATGADKLAFLNNALYGVKDDSTAADLIRWDSAGAATVLFSWLGADGGDSAGFGPLLAMGGELFIFRTNPFPSIWVYDGVAPTMAAQFATNFSFGQAVVFHGILYFSLKILKGGGASAIAKPAIGYWAGGTYGVAWEADDYENQAQAPSLAVLDNRLMFVDTTRDALMAYDPALGGVQTVATGITSSTSVQPIMAASTSNIIHLVGASTTGYKWPASGGTATSAYVKSSLFDFEVSVEKQFRAVIVDFESATDGDGGSVDISYRLNDLDADTFTSLATDVDSGVENTFTGTVTGRAIGIKVTLNKGTSTRGPVLRRVYVRAIPKQEPFRRNRYNLMLAGVNGESHGKDHVGGQVTRDGLEQFQELQALATAGTPVTVTDLTGTYEAVLENEGFQAWLVRSPGVFIASVQIREV